MAIVEGMPVVNPQLQHMFGVGDAALDHCQWPTHSSSPAVGRNADNAVPADSSISRILIVRWGFIAVFSYLSTSRGALNNSSRFDVGTGGGHSLWALNGLASL